MNEENFLVQFIPSKHCFLQFSNKWFQKLNNPKCLCLRLVHPLTKEELRFTWAPQPSFGVNDCSVGMNATFARGLNLHEGELVVISSEDSATSIRQAYLTPLTPDDYEILEMSREVVEVSLLDQIRVVYVKQVISVWVSKTLTLKLTVDCLEPDLSYGRLEQMTELIIENVTKDVGITTHNKSSFTSKVSNGSSVPREDHRNRESSFWSLFENYLPNRVLDLLKPSETSSKNEQIFQQSDNSYLLCRIHPVPCSVELLNCCNSAHNESVHSFNVFVDKWTLQKVNIWPKDTFVNNLLEGKQKVALCRLEAVPKRKPKSSNSKVTEDNKIKDSCENGASVSVFVRLYRIDESCRLSRRTNVSCVYVSQFLRKLLDLATGSRVKLSAYNPPLDIFLKEITLVVASKLSAASEVEAVCQQFRQRLSGQREGVLVNNCCPLAVVSGSVLTLALSPSSLLCWPLTQADLDLCPVHVVAEEHSSSLQPLLASHHSQEVSQKTCVFGKLVEEGVSALDFGLQLTEHHDQQMVLDNILITGKAGSGKSRLAEALYTTVCGPPHFVYVSVIHCKPLKGKKPESIGKMVTEQLEECLYYQPSVLVLEDLQCVAGVSLVEPQQQEYYLRVATVLKELLWQVSSGQQCVRVVVTADCITQIHPQLLKARGRHTFTTLLNIPPLHKEDRQLILSELLSSRVAPEPWPELEDVAGQTQGCVAQDLGHLVDRVIFKASQKHTQTQLQVSAADWQAALGEFVSADLTNVSLVRSPHTFDSVGGLGLAKQLLTEVLIWPNMYPEVFSQCPLRLERGVLLYGAPGTGKTLLANAIAGQSGLNFITVKGPELLSKYIGASEEAVRNVFQKAQSAAPCILFFDEFESLAPRRGHDSTGVTDRVGNQLLTQMDGVEALEGVWVIATASRPDLLDPALLRPGRIGTHIHCPLPEKEERLAILQCLSSRLPLSEDVDLTLVAAGTEGYTGADLQAVLVTAQMAAYDSLHQDSDDELSESMSSVGEVVVNQQHLLSALQDTQPSLKPEDRLRFQLIYERFEKSRGGVAQWSSAETSQRVTLA